MSIIVAKQEEELEVAVLAKMAELDSCSDNKVVHGDVTVGQIKKLLGRVSTFIDYAKFEFGEEVTGG